MSRKALADAAFNEWQAALDLLWAASTDGHGGIALLRQHARQLQRAYESAQDAYEESQHDAAVEARDGQQGR